MDKSTPRKKIRLDFFSDREPREQVPFAYGREVYTRLMQSQNKHIIAEMQYVADRFFYLFKSPNGYTFGVSDADYEPRIQQVTEASVLGVLNLASIPGGFSHVFCPIEAWRDAPFPTFGLNDQAYERTPIERDGRTLQEAQAFLDDEATAQDLWEIFEELGKVEVQIALGGEHKGDETIQRRFWAWAKGTRRIDIETCILQHPRWQKR